MTKHSVTRSGTLRYGGFTLIELMIGSVIMLVVVIGALTVYSRSNKITVDQNQYAELQHDVRSAMHLMMRDVRMAGAGLPIEFGMYSLEGWDNESQGHPEIQPDRLRIMGNLEEPLHLPIENYSGGVGGGSANAELELGAVERNPYPREYLIGKPVLVLPRPGSGCIGGEIRAISHLQLEGAKDKVIFAPGHSPYNPPGGLVGDCPADAWPGGLITFANIIEYWLDTTGTQSGTGYTLANGYIGEPGVLYATKNNVHFPLARNIENFQVRYNGDLNNDGKLDGFTDWEHDTEGNPVMWDLEQVARIRQIRVWILGRTANPFVGLGGQPPNNIHHYRRPVIANSPAASTDDFHRRFLLESTANIRNMSLNLYNMGER